MVINPQFLATKFRQLLPEIWYTVPKLGKILTSGFILYQVATEEMHIIKLKTLALKHVRELRYLHFPPLVQCKNVYMGLLGAIKQQN